MKKIAQLALLMSLASATASYCWEWSDLVPTRLSNWYYQPRPNVLKRKKNTLQTTNPHSKPQEMQLITAKEMKKRKEAIDASKAKQQASSAAQYIHSTMRLKHPYNPKPAEPQQGTLKLQNWWRSYNAAPTSASKALKK